MRWYSDGLSGFDSRDAGKQLVPNQWVWKKKYEMKKKNFEFKKKFVSLYSQVITNEFIEMLEI